MVNIAPVNGFVSRKPRTIRYGMTNATMNFLETFFEYPIIIIMYEENMTGIIVCGMR